ncbi:hypothetical protein EK21DRAFT_94765 [Setomelanomma holmii]|uniref:Uncharacterized protein n=1 Tax=Setomelanomma holmii TaxID=210430 RepID=A0A9P4GX58_9PLEO|nr:hypothetical protein EK21DRAFT_94765 [Setomelanomma holmii]
MTYPHLRARVSSNAARADVSELPSEEQLKAHFNAAMVHMKESEALEAKLQANAARLAEVIAQIEALSKERAKLHCATRLLGDTKAQQDLAAREQLVPIGKIVRTSSRRLHRLCSPDLSIASAMASTRYFPVCHTSTVSASIHGMFSMPRA